MSQTPHLRRLHSFPSSHTPPQPRILPGNSAGHFQSSCSYSLTTLWIPGPQNSLPKWPLLPLLGPVVSFLGPFSKWETVTSVCKPKTKGWPKPIYILFGWVNHMALELGVRIREQVTTLLDPQMGNFDYIIHKIEYLQSPVMRIKWKKHR